MSALPLGRASLLAVLAVIAIGCSSNNNSPSPTVATSPEAVSPSTTSPPATSSSAAAVDLSGTWSGQYDGAFNGTFTLTWTQSNSKLTGSIKLSTDGTVNLNGVVTGNSIRFGTVGSTAITYSARSPATPCRARTRSAVRPGATGAPRRPPEIRISLVLPT